MTSITFSMRHSNFKKIGLKTLVMVLSFVMILSLSTDYAYADTTGQHSGLVFTGWTNPQNAAISDNVYSTATLNTSVQSPGSFRAKDFSFNIPEGSTINGIEVTMERKHTKSGGAGLYDEMACLIINNVDVYASNRAVLYTYWSTTESVKTFGSPTDLWGQVLTPAIVNSPNFGFFFNSRKITHYVVGYIDYIGMTVYYTPPIVNPPVIAPHNDINVEATSAAGAIVEFTVTAIDDIDPVVIVNSEPSSGTQFPLGTTTVTSNATDSAGNIALPVTFNVNVRDTTAPVINLTGSDPININQDLPYTEDGATWTDVVDGTGNAIVGGDNVNTSVPGTYIVTYNYTDAAGNAALQVTRTVNVLDTTLPIISPQIDLTIEATSANGAIVTFAPLATDNVDPSVTVNTTPSSGSQFALGTTLVTCEATDAAGNIAIPVTFSVTVQDTTAPVITIEGTDPYFVDYASIYIEPGATWTDAVDGTGSAIVGGQNVDTLTPGDYLITYDFTDVAGNVALQVSRTVTVRPWSTINVSKDVKTWKGKDTIDPYLFSIQLNGENNQIISQTISATYDRLAPGSYTIFEIPDPKYDLKNILGDNDSNPSNGVTLTIGSGETWNLTFINWKYQIKIK